VSTGQPTAATATVNLVDADGGERTTALHRTGPVDAVCQALNAFRRGYPIELVNSAVKSVTEENRCQWAK